MIHAFIKNRYHALKKEICLVVVFGIFASCSHIIGLEDLSEEQVSITAPTNGAMVTDSIVGFSWSSVDQADAYMVQVVKPSFENASQVLLDSLVNVDSTFTSGNINIQLSVRRQPEVD